MKVLNIYPSENKLGANVQLDEAVKINNVTMKFNKDQMQHIYPKSASLKVWMEGGFIESINSDPLGIDPELKEQIIDVTLNSIDEFETSEENFIYQFDVVVFGFWDYSGGFSLSTEKSKGIVEKYIKNGYGFIAGHDSIILEFLDDDNDDKPIGLTAIRDLFGIGIHQKEGSYEGAKS
ncbi:DUF11 domain-containing protein [Histomonas meleagridis]|uniref:DUF11 domain-containing protein n=1 Tax=Histomonas meleagridis TaxID=135588 RepID=UPI00355A4A9C|nr:DUF11 domain-containing protein [Histomonas meleagridis]